MIIETTYSPYDLVNGICESCGEESSEIDPTTDMCIDCIEEAKLTLPTSLVTFKSFSVESV